MSTSAERIKAAKERDEAGIQQEEPEAPDFEAPDGLPKSEQPPAEPEPEPEPEPTPEPQPEGMDTEQVADLEKAAATYIKRVEKVFGAGNVPPTCPHCAGLGFDLTGGEAPPEFHEHGQYKECDECAGMGMVKTGSRVMGHELHECPKCVGRGYLERLPAPAAVPEQGEQFGTPAWMGTVATP